MYNSTFFEYNLIGDYMKKIWFIFVVVTLLIYPTFSKIKYYDINTKYIALGFENTSNKYTTDIISLLFENDYKATFFINKNNTLDKEVINLIISKNNDIDSYNYIDDNLRKKVTLKQKYRTSKEIASYIIKNVKENDVIIMNNDKEHYEALKIIIPKLKEFNYNITTISELLEIEKIREQFRF